MNFLTHRKGGGSRKILATTDNEVCIFSHGVRNWRQPTMEFPNGSFVTINAHDTDGRKVCLEMNKVDALKFRDYLNDTIPKMV